MRRSLLAVITLVASVLRANAGGFDVKGAEITKGETEIGFNSAFFSGFPVNADPLRATGEIAIGYGFSEWWKAGLKLSFDKPVGGDLEAVTVGAEAQFLLQKMQARGPAIAMFAGIDVAIQDDQTNTLTLGPVWSWALDNKTAFNLNTFFTRTLGPNSSDATDFSYAWQITREVRECFSLGVEGYGILPDIGHTPGLDFQEHRIGPVMYFDRGLNGGIGNGGAMRVGAKSANGNGQDEGGPKLAIEAGILFGLTDATQDRVYKLKGALTF